MLSKFTDKKMHAPAHFRILVWIAVGTLLVFGIALLLQGQMDLQNYQQQIKRIVKERTGRDIYIRGGVNVVLLPMPKVYVSGVELRDINEGKPVPALTAEMLLITPTIQSLFSDHLEIASVAMKKPTIEVSRSDDNLIHWDWLEKEFFEVLKTDASATSQSVDISDGTIVYYNTVTGRKIRVDSINISGTTGGVPNFSGDLTYDGRQFNVQVTGTGSATADGFIPLSVEVNTDEQNYVKLDGSMRISGGNLDLKGKAQVDIKDLYQWASLPPVVQKPTMERFVPGADPEAAAQAVLPVKFSGNWEQSGDKIALTDIKWEGLNSLGTGQLGITFSKTITVDSRMHFASLDFARWRTLVEAIAGQLVTEETGRYIIDESLRESVLPNDVKLALDLTADEMLVGGQVWQNAQLHLNMEDAVMTINQLFVELPGESTLALFGVVSQSATSRGMRFEGTVEADGKSLKKTLGIFDQSVADMPDIGFENFFVRSNVYVSNDQIRMSEADVKLDDLRLGGGLVIYYDTQNPRIEADVRLQDTNFDYIRDLWRERQAGKETGNQPGNFFLKFDKDLNFSWLKNLKTAIDLKINVDRFTFLERSGDKAYLRLFAQQGELGVYNVRFYYPNDTTEMNLTLNVQGEKPLVNLLVNTNQIDTAYFNPAAPAQEGQLAPQVTIEKNPGSVVTISPQSQPLIVLAQNTTGSDPSDVSVDSVTNIIDEEKNKKSRKAWPEELIDMSWMEGYNGIFDITIGKLTHKDIVVNKIKLRANLTDSNFSLQNAGFDYWGGNCEVTGSLYGGKVPGVSLGLTLYNVEMKELLGTLTGYSNISGKASVSGTLSTSGVNYLSWLAQAEAKIAVSGRGVRVEGFNLDGVVNTVNASRTAADVLDNVDRALVQGSTNLSMDGAINVKNGVMRSPGIALKTGTIVGNLTGDISLVPWTLDLGMIFQFPTLNAEAIPTLLVQLNGSIDDPRLTTDTSSLEAYVVRSIKQK